MDILISQANQILTLQFNRPAKKNAITMAMYQTLADALQSADADSSIRVILLTGLPQIFSAGNDLEDFLNNPISDVDASPIGHFMRQLSQASKPVIAAVAGAAIGIGTTLLMHCDLVYAAEDAKFSLLFIKLGLCPEFGSTLLLPRLAGHARATEKLLLGEAFSAQEALAMGLVNALLPHVELLGHAQAQAAKLVALPMEALRATKRLIKQGQQAAIAAQIAQENLQFSELLQAPAAQQAMAGFLAKRS